MTARDDYWGKLRDALDTPVHAPMETHSHHDGSCLECPWPAYEVGPEETIDAILASDVALHAPQVRRMRAVLEETWEVHKDRISTHYPGCYRFHAGCLTRVLLDLLEESTEDAFYMLDNPSS